jgi:hypothetical protein
MLTLFYSVSKKYQPILPLNAKQHIKMCVDKINHLFIVYAENVDVDELAKNLKYHISDDVKITLMHEQEAADIIGYNHTTDYRIRYDGYMLMIACKLHVDVLTKCDNVIVTDPDNFILKPTPYLENSKGILYHSTPFTVNWSKMARIVLGDNINFDYDFMNEKILMQRKILEPMRDCMKDALLKYSYKRHSWYDIAEDDYNRLAGVDWPKLTNWFDLPKFVQEEIQQMIKPEMIQTEWYEDFSDYMMYGYYAMMYHPNEVILRETKVQNGPWGDGSADIFLNRASEKNSIDAFNFICNNVLYK